ncbi:MAG: hypothetical protein KatS3mg022_2920 [Armatimonadota bacterium]|nr:MAG: hypothetical protein KatS3mg022_2920 [Armatimonadota bacterium]
MEIWITPHTRGRQLVRQSLPFPAGFLREGQSLLVSDAKNDIAASVRVLTQHPRDRSARRAMVTFVYTFESTAPARFQLTAAPEESDSSLSFPVTVHVRGERVTIAYEDGATFTAQLLAPQRSTSQRARVETIEENTHFLWLRVILPDPQWTRIIEVRADVLGGVAVIAHLQRHLPGDGYAPPFGWELRWHQAPANARLQQDTTFTTVSDTPVEHSLTGGQGCAFLAGEYRIEHPAAPFTRRSKVEAWREGSTLVYRYWRCTAGEKVPMQESAWRRAEFVISPASTPSLKPTLQYPQSFRVDPQLWHELYGIEPLPKLPPELQEVLRYHHEAILRSVAAGDDWGNITGYSDGSPHGDVFGMNRLNHCAPLFEEAYRSDDPRLLEAALLWCQNFADLSIWWGAREHGGTRYNNVVAQGGTPPQGDRPFMWRSNDAVSFCTKGFDAFYLAYEETGDPRMKEALEAQVSYASQWVHAHQGECRNVGVVRDFVHLYELTAERRYLHEALRLFRELRTRLWENNLFDQGGKPPSPHLPFFDDDATGLRYGYAKPYIIGYALAGLPALLRYARTEPRLREVVKAVSDFLAESQDPLGGWRYPHPRSSTLILSQAMEHAWQIVQADRAIGATQSHLDTVERVLRQRIYVLREKGSLLSAVRGWEWETGTVKSQGDINTLYRRFEERDFIRDYEQGQVQLGTSPPEGLVYFTEVLAFYLKHRPLSRLLSPLLENEPLAKVLRRVSQRETLESRHIINRQEAPAMLVTANNPNPKAFPILAVWEDEELSPGRKLTMVAATFPNVPGFTCDSWCYESDVDFVDARPLSRGRLQLRHRWRAHPQVLLITVVTPEPGAVEFLAHLELADKRAEIPSQMPFVNLCWQVRRAPAFASKPDPYPEFVKRCFIFTAKGRTFLHEAERRKIPVRSADDPYNNPPWVQMYAAAWIPLPKASPDSWADYSPAQYTTPVIGVVSRDGRYLAALANDSATVMAQAWHDCLHNNPQWAPANAPPLKRRWRLKAYALPNDPNALLKRVGKDFPDALRYLPVQSKPE